MIPGSIIPMRRLPTMTAKILEAHQVPGNVVFVIEPVIEL